MKAQRTFRNLLAFTLLVMSIDLAGLTPAAQAKPPSPGKRNFFPAFQVASSEAAKKVITADFNNDNKADFAVLHWEVDGRGVVGGVDLHKGYMIRVYVNTTPAGAVTRIPTFVQSDQLLYDDDTWRRYPMYNSDFTTGDFNGDGKVDIAVANAHDDHVATYLGNGDGRFWPAKGTPVEDDPGYIAAGDYNGDGKMDVALFHFILGFPGSRYAWKIAFLFGRGDGTFKDMVLKEEDRRDFPGGRGPGPYYYSQTWNFETAPRSVTVHGTPRDGVWVDHALRWYDGGIQGDFRPDEYFRPEGSRIAPLFAPPAVDLVDRGGRVIAIHSGKLGDTVISSYDRSLDQVFVTSGGKPRLNSFGQGVAAADFDADGLPDLVLTSDELGGPGGRFDRRYSSYSLLVAYGLKPGTDPLNVDPATGFDVKRFREIPNGADWQFGHRAWHLAVADLNFDEYPDLITLTSGGIMVHVNQGLMGDDATPPVFSEMEGDGNQEGGGTAAGDPLTLFGHFAGAGQRTMFMVVTAQAPPNKKLAVLAAPDTTAPETILYAELPPDDVLPPGDYELSVFNGSAESSRKKPVKVVLRPLRITGLELQLPQNGAAAADLVVRGWFGDRDLSGTTFQVERTGVSGSSFLPSVKARESTQVILRIPTAKPAGSYSVTAMHPPRPQGSRSGLSVDFSPKIKHVAWFNPGGTRWTDDRSQAIEPGARLEIEGSMFRAPGLTRWRLLRSGTLLAEGTGDVVDKGFDNNNKASFFEFNLPTWITDGPVALQLIAQNGHESPSEGSFGVKQKGSGGGGGGGGGGTDFYFARESLTSTICDTKAINAKDLAEALMKVKATVVNPADFVFTKIDGSELATACSWTWTYDLQDSGGSPAGTATVQAASRELSERKAQDRAPAGGKAVYKSGPIK